MRKLLILLIAIASVAGCGATAGQSGLWEHDTAYRDWDHLRFSWGGHKTVSGEELKQSTEEGWWGKDVPAVPGK